MREKTNDWIYVDTNKQIGDREHLRGDSKCLVYRCLVGRDGDPGKDDEDWKAAEAALEAACQLPGGAARIEALTRAGRLRFEADRKRLSKEVERRVARVGAGAK